MPARPPLDARFRSDARSADRSRRRRSRAARTRRASRSSASAYSRDTGQSGARQMRTAAGRPDHSAAVWMRPSASRRSNSFTGPAPAPTIRSNGGSTLGRSCSLLTTPHAINASTPAIAVHRSRSPDSRHPTGGSRLNSRSSAQPDTCERLPSSDCPGHPFHPLQRITGDASDSARVAAGVNPGLRRSSGRGGRRRPPETPVIDRNLGRPRGGQVRQDPADQAGELEPVPAAWAGDDDVGPARQEIDRELRRRARPCTGRPRSARSARRPGAGSDSRRKRRTIER